MSMSGQIEGIHLALDRVDPPIFAHPTLPAGTGRAQPSTGCGWIAVSNKKYSMPLVFEHPEGDFVGGGVFHDHSRGQDENSPGQGHVADFISGHDSKIGAP